MPKLTFEEEKHQYFLDDSLIPSVSEILKPIHDKIYGKINAKTLKKASPNEEQKFIGLLNLCQSMI